GNRQIVEGVGEKIVPIEDAEFSLADTLQEPDMIAVRAASNRLELARNADVLHSALDAAKSAGSADPLTKMLCHQLAAAHRGAMKLIHQGMAVGVPNVDAMRSLGTAVRMMQTFQSGMETLQKLKTGNKQTVVVKHVQMVQIGEGGQAVVTGNV